MKPPTVRVPSVVRWKPCASVICILMVSGFGSCELVRSEACTTPTRGWDLACKYLPNPSGFESLILIKHGSDLDPLPMHGDLSAPALQGYAFPESPAPEYSAALGRRFSPAYRSRGPIERGRAAWGAWGGVLNEVYAAPFVGGWRPPIGEWYESHIVGGLDASFFPYSAVSETGLWTASPCDRVLVHATSRELLEAALSGSGGRAVEVASEFDDPSFVDWEADIISFRRFGPRAEPVSLFLGDGGAVSAEFPQAVPAMWSGPCGCHCSVRRNMHYRAMAQGTASFHGAGAGPGAVLAWLGALEIWEKRNACVVVSGAHVCVAASPISEDVPSRRLSVFFGLCRY